MDSKRQKELLIANLKKAAEGGDHDGGCLKLTAGVIEACIIPLLQELEPVVHCDRCKHCQESCYAGYYYCDAWDQDINMQSIDPEKYFCAEGETR